MHPKYVSTISELDNLVGLAPKEREKMETVTDLFPFHSNEYSLSLFDWKDGHDPLRRIAVPDLRELNAGGFPDPSCENNYPKQPGLQHKHEKTGLIFFTTIYGGISPHKDFPEPAAKSDYTIQVPAGHSRELQGKPYWIFPGLARRTRCVMSPAMGKSKFPGHDDGHVSLHCHTTADRENAGMFRIPERNLVAREFADHRHPLNGFEPATAGQSL